MDNKGKTKEPLTRELTRPFVALGVLLSILVFSLGDLMEIIPFFTPVVASRFFPFFHEIHDLLAAVIVLYAAYKHHTRLALAAILLYLTANIPYIIVEFPKNTPEILRILFSGFVALLGVWLINRLHINISSRQQAEVALRESEEKYRSLVDNALVGVFRTNLKGDILYVNDTLVSMLGFDSATEMIAGGAVVRYKNLNDRAILLKELTEKGKVNSFEFEVLTKTGGIKNVILNSVLEGDTLSGMLVDLTERKRADEVLQQSEERLRVIFESLALGVIITDLNGRIVQLNEAKVRMHGYDSKEKLVGRSLLELISEKDRASVMDNRRQRLEYGYSGSVEYTFLRKDGSEFPAEASSAVLRDALGNPIGVVSITEDITERKKAEARLEQSAREWQTTFNSISDWVSVHDKDYRILKVNRAFADALKMKPEEIIGRHCYEVIHGEHEASQYCAHKEALETGKPSQREFFNHHLGIYMEVLSAPIFDESGEITTTVHIGRDITERKKMEAQLMVTDRLASIGELASGIAHELNNPLTGVIGFSELLLEKDAPDDVKEDLMIINSEAKRAAGVVRNLLIFARKHPQEKQAVNINNAIKLVLELRAYEQKLNNIAVNTQLAADLPEVMADTFQLQQVFLNIIINAEYFMIETHKRGALAIITERVGDIIRISLADDGPGIAQENLEHIFDPFFTTKEVGKGTGLDLSICHGTVTAHGGRIYAESEPGKGATFIVELPISQ